MRIVMISRCAHLQRVCVRVEREERSALRLALRIDSVGSGAPAQIWRQICDGQKLYVLRVNSIQFLILLVCTHSYVQNLLIWLHGEVMELLNLVSHTLSKPVLVWSADQ
jgi:hypothetical protein